MTALTTGTSPTAEQLLSGIEDVRRIPLSAIAQVTRRCNQSCRHCYESDRSGEELPIDRWELVLHRLADAGVLFLTLTGGEPTMRGDFVDLVRLARSLAFAVRIKSNGSCAPPEAWDPISAATPLRVQLTVFSADPERHDCITRVRGSHARCLAAARRLVDNGTPVVFACPLMEDTFDGYERLVDLAGGMGAGFSFDPHVVVREDGCREPCDYRLTDDQMATLFADPRMAKDIPEPWERPLDHPVCRIGKAFVALAPNGDVWPCLRMARPVGNLVHGTLEEIWIDNPELDRLRNIRWGDLPSCRRCALRAFCNRCHVDAMIEDGDMLGASRMACRSARVHASLRGGPRVADQPASDILPRGVDDPAVRGSDAPTASTRG